MNGADDNKNPSKELVVHLQQKIREVLDPLLLTCQKVVLLDFPDYSNVGDSAIWLGELAYLESQKHLELVYAADMNTYSREYLGRVLGEGIILLSGGGNFGDLWGRHQVFRERVLADFPNNQIIQLPVSVSFSTADSLERSRQIMNEHRNLTLLMRDRFSFDLAQKSFSAKVLLCPDMAFFLGCLNRVKTEVHDVIWLKRTDKESLGSRPHESFCTQDWTGKESGWLAVLTVMVTDLLRKFPVKAQVLQRILPALFQLLAQKRLARGIATLSQGETVVTDRLHGHILCLLLGIPHVLVNNNNDKIRRFYEEWTQESVLTKYYSSEDQALRYIAEMGLST